MSDLRKNYNEPTIVQAIRQGLVRPEREGEYWTDDERDMLRKYFDEGMDITAISVLFKRSEAAVLQQVEKMDLYGRKTNPRRQRSCRENICLSSSCSASESLCPLKQTCNENKEVCSYE